MPCLYSKQIDKDQVSNMTIGYNMYNKPKAKLLSIYSVLIILVIIFSIYYWKSCQSRQSNRYNKLIIQKAKKYYLDPNLVKAVIWRESNFRANAVGGKGEIGLMQLMQKAAVKDWENYYKINIAEKGILFNPGLNVEIGCWYLARCRRHWRKYTREYLSSLKEKTSEKSVYKESEILMLAEYNAGYTNVKKWLSKTKLKNKRLIDKIKFKSTRKYIISIMAQYEKYAEAK